MDIPDLSEIWPTLFAELLGQQALADAAHDPNHILRVVTNARRLSLAEGADWTIVMPAAWLHDCVAVPKSSPDRRIASRLCAHQAVEWLEKYEWLPPVIALDAARQAVGTLSDFERPHSRPIVDAWCCIRGMGRDLIDD